MHWFYDIDVIDLKFLIDNFKFMCIIDIINENVLKKCDNNKLFSEEF